MRCAVSFPRSALDWFVIAAFSGHGRIQMGRGAGAGGPDPH